MDQFRTSTLVLLGAVAGWGLLSVPAWADQAPQQASAKQTQVAPPTTKGSSAKRQTTDKGKGASNKKSASAITNAQLSSKTLRDGQAEERLISIYRMLAAGQNHLALDQTRALVRDHPNFQLAHLLLGDLLAAKSRPLLRVGDIPGGDRTAPQWEVSKLADLRNEARQRIQAHVESPPAGHIPSAFLNIDRQHRYALALDAERSRLYLFKNTSDGLQLVAHYYASVGKLGIDKRFEGDQRTPLGIYSITSRLTSEQLPDFYGSGALPINYPNALDQRQGRTGSGIWLHGTPPDQFARPPLASDGCIVLADQDFERLMSITQPHAIPVVIAQKIDWVPPETLLTQRQEFEHLLEGWREAKSRGDLKALRDYYTVDFRSAQKHDLDGWMHTQVEQLTQAAGRSILIKAATLLYWSDTSPSLVVTFAELFDGARTGLQRRQHWVRENGRWRIFHEGVSR